MNIAMFLSPKSEIEYLYNDMTVRQAMEKMEYHRYQCLAVLTREGKFEGVVSEGDLLWCCKNHPNFTFSDTEHMSLSQVSRHFQYKTVSVDTDMESLVSTAYRQSFVPVVDDQEHFIGIIKRSDIIKYLYSKSKSNELTPAAQYFVSMMTPQEIAY